MFGYNGYNPNPVAYQMQANQNRILQQYGYGSYPQYQQNTQQQAQTLNGRPVSSLDEAKASMIDLDGSLFVFPDIANGKIYTKQIMLDGTADFRIYSLDQDNNSMQVVKEPQQTQQAVEVDYVLRKDFDRIVKRLEKKIEALKEGAIYEQSTSNVQSGNEK